MHEFYIWWSPAVSKISPQGSKNVFHRWFFLMNVFCSGRCFVLSACMLETRGVTSHSVHILGGLEPIPAVIGREARWDRTWFCKKVIPSFGVLMTWWRALCNLPSNHFHTHQTIQWPLVPSGRRLLSSWKKPLPSGYKCSITE